MNIANQGYYDPTLMQMNKQNTSDAQQNLSQQFNQQKQPPTLFQNQHVSALITSLLSHLLLQLVYQLSQNNAFNQGNSGSTSGTSSTGQGDASPKQPTTMVDNPFTQTEFPISSAQSIPANNANGTGAGDISVDPNTGDLKGSILFSGLTGEATMVHIHSGKTGETGPVILNLEKDINNPNKYNIPEGSKFEGQNLKDILAGDTYINVHTEQNPAGEVRGQIASSIFTKQPEPVIETITFGISSSQSIPANNASGRGFGEISVNPDTGDVKGEISFSPLTGEATMVHIHVGETGETGPIILSLVKDEFDPNTYNIPEGSRFEGQNLSDLLAGNTYINVHTEKNPAGEVRGQITSGDICHIRH